MAIDQRTCKMECCNRSSYVAAAVALSAAIFMRRRTLRKKQQKKEKPANVIFDRADLPLRALRKVETVISRRTSRMILVLERTSKSHNYSAILRTCEALGIQHVWLISPQCTIDGDVKRTRSKKKKDQLDLKGLEHHAIYAKLSFKWLTIRTFTNTQDCVRAMREDGREIWVSELGQEAICLSLSNNTLEVPDKFCLVMGTEATGASKTMLEAADKRVYLPLHGFADSLNVSVAAAMLIQRIVFLDPSVMGAMSNEERAGLRAEWYPKMARTDAQRELYTSLIKTPVEPLDDMRRPMEHRAGWLGKKVRKKAIKRGADFVL